LNAHSSAALHARVLTSADAFREHAGAVALSLSKTLSVSITVAAWLVKRGIVDPAVASRFLEPKLAELSSPDGMVDRKAAASRIARALRDREPICVFGDYDCDGMTAAAVMTEVLSAFGGRVTAFVASRFEGGYGVSPAAVERVLASSARLLVTCDCGSSDHASLARLRAHGVDVVVIDHHLVPAEPLPALAFLNPHRPECGFPYKGLASCGLALSVGAALRAELGRAYGLRPLLDLVAIGTIADVAPLTGDNRALVRAGLKVLERAERPGLRALMDLAGIDRGSPLTGQDVAFRIAPRLNAPGRLGSPEPALRLLLERDPDRARELAAEIEQMSLERRAVQDRMLDEALAEIDAQGYRDAPAIVLGREGWNHGIVGIVAGRLADRYARPVIVIGFTEGRGRGSVRGPRGFPLYDALGDASHTMVRFGGHQAAAGLELELARLPELRSAFIEAVKRRSVAPGADSLSLDGVSFLSPDEDPSRVLDDLTRLEPCGEGNPSPELVVRGKVLMARAVSGGHLKLELELGGRGHRISGFGVAMGHLAEELAAEVVVSGALRRDTYRGGGAVELKIARFWPDLCE
jgi:single-stranded-DNA-specific exonuclease